MTDESGVEASFSSFSDFLFKDADGVGSCLLWEGGQGRRDAIGWLISERQAGGGTGVQIGWSEGILFSDWWGRYS